MSFALRREKALPDIPVDVEVEDGGLWFIPSPQIATSANTDKALPSIRVENTLSEEEMSRLHDLWNGAGLSARTHRRRQRGHNLTPRRIPAPISIPEIGNVLPPLSSACSSIISATPPIPATRKRWGFLSARAFPEPQEAKKVPNALETLRAMARGRLRRKLRYAKSAPNLGDQAERAILEPMPIEVASRDVEASGSRTSSSPGESAIPRAIIQPEEMDENAIYFTIDPNWRASHGSVQFQFITPIPDSPTSLERPDSPLLHRHFSLDQLSFSAQQLAAETMITTEFPDDEVLHSIDELHACLEV